MTFGQSPRIHTERKPLQARFFQEPDIAVLESAVNSWLALKPRREIVDVRQTALPGAGNSHEIILSIWYVDD